MRDVYTALISGACLGLRLFDVAVFPIQMEPLPFRRRAGWILFGLLMILCPLWGYPAFASSVKKPIKMEKLIPSNFLDWGKAESGYAVVVDKSRQKIMLYRGDKLFVPEKVYDCSTGENEGPKSKKNDRKTPEGIYFFTNNVEKKYLSPVYGARALPIDYPNLVDRKEGNGGYGIWFHGTNKPLKPKDTNGCIVLDNEDIEEMASLITLFETPIIISSGIEWVPPSELQKEASKIKEIIEGWRRSWQGKNIDTYMSFYNQRFTSSGKDWHEWRNHKFRLAKKYPWIDVDIRDIRLLSNDGVVLATFKQTYRSPAFESRGTKKLYFTKNSDQWKIIAEFFRGDERVMTVKKPVLFSREEVEDFIHLWKNSWEGQDLERYISCYDRGFTSRNMDIGAWEKHKQRLNGKYQSIQVEISGLKIKRLTDDTAEVRFTQDYEADGYRDLGIKKMLLIKEGKEWKIKKEDWTPIRRKSRR